MHRLSLLFLFLIFRLVFLQAQENTSLNSAEILLALKKLNTVGSVLYVAAHPDDENTRLLAYLSKEKNLRTGYLSITRGDGGQNLVGKEQGDLLGLIRTQELLAARRVDGAEQFFTRANDFGYSKNPEETLRFWDKDSVLSDVVWCIRRFKPDVIICRFPPTGEGGHGHHTASAILALEAFEAAADPKKFSHQLAHTETWQAKRVFWNTFVPNNNTPAPGLLKLDVGAFNPLLGKGCGEIASESRSMHKSQGFGTAKGRGISIEYFKQMKGDSVKDLFEGIDQSWKRLPAAAKIQGQMDELIKKYEVQKPEGSLPALVGIHKLLQQLDEKDGPVRYWKRQKLKETETLLLACAGLWLEAGASDYSGIPGMEVSINTQVIARNEVTVRLNKISWFGQTDTMPALALKRNELYSFRHKEKIPANAAYSNPYWLNEPHGTGMFSVRNQLLIGQPENNSSLNVTFHIDLAGLLLEVTRKLTFKQTDPVKGEVYRPFEILPPATVNLSEKVYVFFGAAAKKILFTIKANTGDVSGKLIVNGPANSEGWVISYEGAFKLINKGDEAVIEAMVTPGKNSGKLSAVLEINGNKYSKSISRVEYDHIPFQFALSEAEASLVNAAISKAGTSIGYIPGAGDEVPACLKQIGYSVTLFTDEMLAGEDLSKYSAIVTGIRAFNTNDKLALYHKKLMDYVNAGGNLVMQYNTNSRVGPLKTSLGPYPFTISRDRVTDETAEVRILNTAHPALNYPNKIGAADFEGWKQERGIYFATEVDKNYESILSLNDPGEKPMNNSLIIARYGKGNFVYTGLVFFRQLPAGVPGAYRLMANLLSLPQNK